MCTLFFYVFLATFSGILHSMEKPTFDYNAALHEAIGDLNIAQARYALRKGASVESTNRTHNASLHQLVFRAERCDETAQEEKVLPIMALLVEYKANIDRLDARGRSPLHLATFFDAKPIMGFLQEKGANQEIKDDEGRTLLDAYLFGWRCRQLLTADYNKAHELLEKGAHPDAARNKYGFALHNALVMIDKAKVGLLLAYHANPDSAGLNSKRPLHYLIDIAVGLRDDQDPSDLFELARMLVHHKARVHALDREGNTPIHYAALKKMTQWVVFLLLNKASLAVQNEAGQTPLHCLVRDSLYTKHKRESLRSFLLLSASNHVKELPGAGHSLDELTTYYLGHLESLLSMEDVLGKRVIDYCASRTICDLLNPSLVHVNYYADAVSFCKSCVNPSIEVDSINGIRVQRSHQRTKSLE